MVDIEEWEERSRRCKGENSDHSGSPFVEYLNNISLFWHGSGSVLASKLTILNICYMASLTALVRLARLAMRQLLNIDNFEVETEPLYTTMPNYLILVKLFYKWLTLY